MKKLSTLLFAFLLFTNIHAQEQTFRADSRMGFVENKGQITNQNNQPNQTAQYLFDTRQGMNVQLRKNGLSYDTFREFNEEIRIHRLDLELLGARHSAKLIAKDALPGISNHYSDGKAVAEHVKSFEKIRYDKVYEGVDFVVSITDAGEVKYDFEIEHAQQAEQIQLQYKGFDSFKIVNGELVFELSGLTLKETIPASWTSADGKPIDVHYFVVSEHEGEVVIGLEVSNKIDSTSAIVIDPMAILEWGTYYGDELSDVGNAIATDSLGNVFATGTTHSMNGFASEGSYQSVFAGGNTDAYLVKFNQHGLRHWATYYGGSGDDEGLNIDLDNYENIYLVGKTTSTDSIGTETAHQSIHGGGTDGFVARFGRYGELIWDSYIGGSGDDVATSCFADDFGNVAVVGYTDAGGFLQNDSIIPLSAYTSGKDGFMAWFNNEGALTQSRFIGGEADDMLTGIEVDSLRNVILVGSTNSSSNIASGGGFQSTLGGSQDAFILKIDTTDTVVWATYFGGDSLDAATGIESVGDTLFISGNTQSQITYNDTLGNQTMLGGNMDGFVLSLLGDGSLNWFTYLGAENDDFANAISRDYAGMIYLIGTSESDSLSNVQGGQLNYGLGDKDVFVSKYNKEGIHQWGTYFGDVGADTGNDIVVFGVTAVYITGKTSSENNIALNGPEEAAHQDFISEDVEDAFVARITQDQSTLPISLSGSYGNGNYAGPPPSVGVCLGDSIKLEITGGALGIGSEWIWYVDECGETDNFIGEGEYIWVSPEMTTVYYVRSENVDEQSECVSEVVHVDYPNTVVADSLSPACIGSMVMLNANGGYSYQWTGPNDFFALEQSPIIDTVQAESEGTYQVIGFTQFGCSDTTEVELTLLPSPIFSSQTVSPICFGDQTGSITLSSSNDSLTYNWLSLGTDTSHVSGLSAGTYFVIATNEFGCTRMDSIVLDQPEPLIKELEYTPAYCDQSNGSASIEVASISDYTVTWLPMNVNGDDISGLPPGDYTVMVSNDLGCEQSAVFTILNIDDFTAIIEPDSLFLDFWSTIEVSAYAFPDTVDNTYAWSPTNGVSCITCANTVLDPDTSTTYFVEITSAHGCTSVDSVYVFRELPIPTAFVPTVFSPNNDGLNDQLCVKCTRVISFQLKIYNRYGVEVFSSNDEGKCWDGSINGVPQTGSFVFTIDAILEDEMTHRETGNITIKQ